MTIERKTLTESNADEIAEWCGGRAVVAHNAIDHNVTSPGVNVPCGEDVKRASLGDTVVLKDDGNFEVYKPWKAEE